MRKYLLEYSNKFDKNREAIVRYLTATNRGDSGNKYSDSATESEKRNIRRQAEHFRLLEGVLQYKQVTRVQKCVGITTEGEAKEERERTVNDYIYEPSECVSYLEVPTSADFPLIVKHYHENIVNHGGRDKTVAELKKK